MPPLILVPPPPPPAQPPPLPPPAQPPSLTSLQIPEGYLDKVGQLAEALVELTGIAMSVDRIKLLYDALDDYDKRAVEVHLRLQQPNLRGRFSQQKQTGHTTVEQMRRYINNSFICLMCVYICPGIFSLEHLCR